jgi:hypothetical protein
MTRGRDFSSVSFFGVKGGIEQGGIGGEGFPHAVTRGSPRGGEPSREAKFVRSPTAGTIKRIDEKDRGNEPSLFLLYDRNRKE